MTNQPTLFQKPKPDYMAEVKSRLNKLDMMRTFKSFNGTNRQARLIYTLPITCEHTEFEQLNFTEYKCSTCGQIITEKQIQNA